ncbi:MAG: hypothetical protein LC676_08145 [Loktanella sp.]|nr:hypothetical protein [Loktanella sp.]
MLVGVAACGVVRGGGGLKGRARLGSARVPVADLGAQRFDLTLDRLEAVLRVAGMKF